MEPARQPRQTAAKAASSLTRRKRTATRAASHRPITRAQRKFLRVFPGGFYDETYIDWERSYKWQASLRWQRELSEASFRRLIAERRYAEVARLASSIESRTNLLFSFEKMALRDAIRSPAGAEDFASGLFEFLHGSGPLDIRFESWVTALDGLPRRQTRVLTWPLATVFGFIAQPRQHFFFKPTVTREALRRCGLSFDYVSRPSWPVYKALLAAVRKVRAEIGSTPPRDMIDMQSFLWVQGSDEYPD